MNSIDEFQKKNQQFREKYRKEKENASLLKKENTRLKKELQDRNNLFNNTPAGIVLIWRGRILVVNDTFLAYMGYKADEMINRNFLNFVHPENLSEARFIHNKWSSGRISQGHYDTRLITERDEEILCSIESRRIRYKGRASYLLNITKLEQREEIRNKKIEEIRDHTELKMAEGIKSLLEKRSGALSEILKSLKVADREKGYKHVEAIERLNAEYEKILGDIHFLKVIISEKDGYDNGKASDLREIIDNAVSIIDNLYGSGRIDIKKYIRTSSSAAGNPEELTEALVQLLLNSISNIPDIGEIHITAEKNSDKLHIYIQDSGPVIVKNRMENIFEPFSFNPHSSGRELGMRFARAVIEKHRGEIEYLSGEDQGNIFQITLPVFNQARKRKKIDLNKLKKARILIVQAEDVARELLAHLLSEKGCRVEKTAGIIEGLTVIKKKKINMIIADSENPGIKITSFWKKCRQINSKIITVALTNGSNTKDSRKLKGTGSDLVISKPFDLKEAVNRISKLFMVKY